jgi:hypothetical protein
MCTIVVRYIQLRSCPKIISNVLVRLILNVEVSMPLEIEVDNSAPAVLKQVHVSVSP